jgi:hypothetical protein
MVYTINTYVFVKKLARKKSRGRPRYGWKGIIKMDLKIKLGVHAVDSSGSVLGPVVSCCAHGDEPLLVL